MLRRREARASLAGFAEYVMPEDRQPADHHRLMLAALQEVLDGESQKNLMLFLPPGSAKSTYGSVIAPAYFLGKNPQLSVIQASNTLTLAERFGRHTRNMLQSVEVQRLWPTRVAADSAAAGRWSTSDGGEYLAAGVGGTITGFRADLAIIDDPVKSREEADSDLIRDKQWDWFISDLRTRLKPDGRVILIMTRWHEDDLAGRLLEREPDDWRVLRLPMEAAAGDPLGRQVGERLWPGWFTEEMVAKAKSDPRAWSSLYQQDPRPKEGAEFKRGWIQRYSGDLGETNRIILVDPASGREGEKRTKRGNDFTSMWVLGLHADGNVYALDMVRERLNLSERIDRLFVLHRKWKPLQVRYEHYGMQADTQALKDEMNRRSYRFRVTEVGGMVQKEARIRRLIWWFEHGKLWFPAHIWAERDGKRVDVLQEFIDEELVAFPYGKHDDALDGLARLAEPKLTLPWPEAKSGIETVVAPWEVLDPMTGW